MAVLFLQVFCLLFHTSWTFIRRILLIQDYIYILIKVDLVLHNLLSFNLKFYSFRFCHMRTRFCSILNIMIFVILIRFLVFLFHYFTFSCRFFYNSELLAFLQMLCIL
ncbi:hypothetical protein PanWU01x14_288470 [Parasponia andersonii]|uniref:Transmembrane protein n=1 Tax=Parasponia andersonii TaxID=3476 RepID=A0A2P5AYG2_PARAD|nr:hypothetical protein PanWU01x14_288470 [Parasponia andersonii]